MKNIIKWISLSNNTEIIMKPNKIKWNIKPTKNQINQGIN